MRSGGGIGDQFNTIGPKVEHFYESIVFSMLFFFLINIIFMNVIFGIIIDTFSQLRDESNIRKLDMEAICFVCG